MAEKLLIGPWRKDKPVFRIYSDNTVNALNGTACGYRYRKLADTLGFKFKGYEDPEKKVTYSQKIKY